MEAKHSAPVSSIASSSSSNIGSIVTSKVAQTCFSGAISKQLNPVVNASITKTNVTNTNTSLSFALPTRVIPTAIVELNNYIYKLSTRASFDMGSQGVWLVQWSLNNYDCQ